VPLALITDRRRDGLWNYHFSGLVRSAVLGWGDDFASVVRQMIDCRAFGFTDGAQAVNYITSHDVEGEGYPGGLISDRSEELVPRQGIEQVAELLELLECFDVNALPIACEKLLPALRNPVDASLDPLERTRVLELGCGPSKAVVVRCLPPAREHFREVFIREGKLSRDLILRFGDWVAKSIGISREERAHQCLEHRDGHVTASLSKIRFARYLLIGPRQITASSLGRKYAMEIILMPYSTGGSILPSTACGASCPPISMGTLGP